MIYVKYLCKCTYLIDLTNNCGFRCPEHLEATFMVTNISEMSLEEHYKTPRYKFNYLLLTEDHLKPEYKRNINFGLNFKLYRVKKDKFGFLDQILDRPVMNANSDTIMINQPTDIMDEIDYHIRSLICEVSSLDVKANLYKELIIKHKLDKQIAAKYIGAVYQDNKVHSKLPHPESNFAVLDNLVVEDLRFIRDNLQIFYDTHTISNGKLPNLDTIFVDEKEFNSTRSRDELKWLELLNEVYDYNRSIDIAERPEEIMVSDELI